MSNNNLVNCSKICVDCVSNDQVDINLGGTDYLGFDFFVKEEQTEEMLKFISVTLETLEVPFIRIYAYDKKALNENDIWTKEKIIKAIKKDATYLQKEAQRNNKSYFRK